MSVVQFFDAKTLRLPAAIEKVTLHALAQASIWEDIDTSRMLTDEDKTRLIIAAVTLLHVTADKIQRDFIPEEAQENTKVQA